MSSIHHLYASTATELPGYWPFTDFNRNVAADLWRVTCATMLKPFSGNMLTTVLLYMIMDGSTAYVGYGTAAGSAARLLVAVPIATWTDKSKHKQKVVQVGSMVTLIYIASSLWSIQYIFQHFSNVELNSSEPHAGACLTCFYLFLLSRILGGISLNFSSSPTAAIVGNSTLLGDRMRINAVKQMISSGSEILGQVILALLFWYQGNVWTLSLVGMTIACGDAGLVSVAFWMCKFEDRYMYADGGGTLPPSAKNTAVDATETIKINYFKKESELSWWAWLEARQMPLRLSIANLLWMIGDGLTSPFWTLLFMNQYELSPTALLFVQLLVPITGLIAAPISMRVSACIGRTETLMVVGVTVAADMVVMAWLLSSTYDKLLVPMLLLYTMQNLAINSAFAPMNSLIMDTVPPNERARFDALFTIHLVNFSASAVVGGYVIEAYGYGQTFCLTAIFNVLAVLIISTNRGRVPRLEADPEQTDRTVLN